MTGALAAVTRPSLYNGALLLLRNYRNNRAREKRRRARYMGGGDWFAVKARE